MDDYFGVGIFAVIMGTILGLIIAVTNYNITLLNRTAEMVKGGADPMAVHCLFAPSTDQLCTQFLTGARR